MPSVALIFALAILLVPVAVGASRDAPIGLLGLPDFIGASYLSPERVARGRAFFESRALSRNSNVSCSSCHVRQLSFGDDRRYSAGTDGAKTTRNVPPLLNLYYSTSFMWDGRTRSLPEQVEMPLKNPDEMNIDWDATIERLSASPSFSGVSLTRSEILLSLASYVHSLVSGSSPFDRYFFDGQNSAISDLAKRGFLLFDGKARCSSCHRFNRSYALFTDHSFHNIGIGWNGAAFSDLGRFAVTHRDYDLGAFKTPTLRNVSITAPYMHNGSLSTLEEVIDYYDRGGNRDAPELDPKIEPLKMTAQDKQDLIEFLNTLSSEVTSKIGGF